MAKNNNSNGILMQAAACTIKIHGEATPHSPYSSEILYGEHLDVLDDRGDGWLRIRTRADSYEGYIQAGSLIKAGEHSHFVCAVCTYIYPLADFKAPPVGLAPFMARLALENPMREKDGFLALADGLGWVWAGHVLRFGLILEDYTQTALRFLGAPYLWGGRTALGIDCSGLVQVALMAAGYECPRDSWQQRDFGPGQVLDGNAALQRGDLVFLKGHVGIMVDEANILNATARTMDVRIENLDEMATCYEGGILKVRRV